MKNKNYFWITANPDIWKIDKTKKNENRFYPAYNSNNNKHRKFDNFKKAEKGDKLVFYQSSPIKKIKGFGKVVKSFYENQNNEEGIEIKLNYLTNKTSWKDLKNDPLLKNSEIIKTNAQGSLLELTKNEYNKIMELSELNYEDILINIIDFNVKLNLDQKLHFPPAMKENLIKRIETNLKQGKHIILIGPPGTGKSKLAKEIAETYVDNNYQMVTATSDWSTFDTIGGYRPNKNGNLEFSPGVFLDCFKNNHAQKSKWLIIDEINRADIDKAFGPLFSALTGDEITLSFKDEGDNYIKVVPEVKNENIDVLDNIFQIKDDWRIIATMNTLDKTSLYEMSYAFMRRFAFVPVPIPEEIDKELLENYFDKWGEDTNDTKNIVELWSTINDYRKIGPAIVKDIINYLSENDNDYVSALISYVLPQFEGLSYDKLNDFYKQISKLNLSLKEEQKYELKAFMTDYFQLREGEEIG
ncbi:enzyme; Degradation of DNA [Halanaerobium saccharolyticum subsp. saccharolyticum DSM 6643]|uniref:Enzyme Degradation of DNA n=1 Tax=Halanaerobium saccharolyticum subsp. saccharolyticum DSM 6643 TaxID=1293054 RepID=M5DYM2_9FIRM|nr:AAA family ATPase [Halanaerobium saccharolyticum]CCU78693.1 enzyme; Degradation of DNA [Halanaerobium saccharolyticum subsp. saccharolyticum DSM 6643]